MSPRVRAGRRLVVAGAACMGLGAEAAGPFIVEDAAIVEPKACQIETWTRRPREGYENFVVPACNPTGNLEIQLGGARIRTDDEVFAAATVQLKTVFREATAEQWGVGLVVGGARIRNRSGGESGTDLYALIPVTVPLVPDKLTLNLNAGLLRSGPQDTTVGTWGVAADWTPIDRLRITGEAFRLLRPRPYFQVGAFVTLVAERVEVVALYGNGYGDGSAGRWFTVGLQLYSPPFLP